MKKENTKVPATVQVEETVAQFKGYTMEELKYQRAMMALKKEFCKAKVMQSMDTLRPKRNEPKSSTGSKFAIAGQIASKLFSNLNTLDYVLMGISLFSTAKKGYKLIRGKK